MPRTDRHENGADLKATLVRLPTPLHAALKAEAQARGVSMAVVVAETLEKELAPTG